MVPRACFLGVSARSRPSELSEVGVSLGARLSFKVRPRRCVVAGWIGRSSVPVFRRDGGASPRSSEPGSGKRSGLVRQADVGVPIHGERDRAVSHQRLHDLRGDVRA